MLVFIFAQQPQVNRNPPSLPPTHEGKDTEAENLRHT